MPTYFLIFILIFAPLAYGTTGPIAMTIVQSLVLSALLWVVVEAFLGRRKLYRPPGLLPLGLLGGLMLLQMLPLPPGLLQVVSPVTWQRYVDTIWLLQPDVWMPLTFNLQGSLQAFSFFFTCVAFYVLAVQCLGDSRRLQKTVRVVTTFAGLYALAAILEALVPNGRILWLLKPWPEFTAGPFGANVNGNHFANLMAMLLPLTVMLFLSEKPVTQYGSWKDRLVEFCSDPRLGAHLLTGFAALITAAAIFLSLSRGGILSTLGAMLVLCLLLAWRRHYRRQALLLIGFVAVLFCFVGIFGWTAIFETFANIRNQQGEISDGRLFYWRDSLALFRDFPIFGTGFGSFIDSYAGYQTIYHGDRIVDHAHNDYVELFVEGGFLALLLAGWAAWRVLRDSWKAFLRRRKLSAVSLYLGSLAGISALLLHCVTEFNLHIGANGLYFAFLAALLVSAASTSSQRGSRSELPQASRRGVRLVLPLLVFVLAGTLLFHLGGLVADATLLPFAERKLADLHQDEQAELLDLTRNAVAWAPLTSSHRALEAKVQSTAGETEEALQAYGRALQLRPLNALYLQRAAGLASDLNRLQLAESLYRAGAVLAQVDLRRIKPYASWLLSHDQQERAFVQIRRALEMAPEQARRFINLMLLNNVASVAMAEAMPERALAWRIYADYLVEVQRETLAERSFRQAMKLMSKEKRPSPGAHWAYYHYLEKRQRYAEALAVILQGLELFPEDAGLHSTAGTLYHRQQIFYRAKEEYLKALLLNPKMEWVRKRLETMD